MKTQNKSIVVKDSKIKNIGKGSPNSFRLTIHHVNPSRSPGLKGSNSFRTTSTYNDVRTYNKAYDIVSMELDSVRKAYWNNHCIAENGMILED